MSHFYQYDTRGASPASQIINLERMVKERDAEIKRLRTAVDLSTAEAHRHVLALQQKDGLLLDQEEEIERLRFFCVDAEACTKRLEDELTKAEQVSKKLMGERERLDREIERLTSALRLIIETKRDPVTIAQEVLGYE